MTGEQGIAGKTIIYDSKLSELEREEEECRSEVRDGEVEVLRRHGCWFEDL